MLAREQPLFTGCAEEKYGEVPLNGVLRSSQIHPRFIGICSHIDDRSPTGDAHRIIARDRQMGARRISFWDIVQLLAAYVAVPVALLYPVGFFALFFQFMNYFFLDFTRHGTRHPWSTGWWP
jgi:hypothetical protein